MDEGKMQKVAVDERAPDWQYREIVILQVIGALGGRPLGMQYLNR